MLRQKLLLVERSKSTHSVQEGGKGRIVDNVSQWGGGAFSQFTCFKYITVCLQIYHVTLTRLDLISSICIILQYVFISERPLKNLYSYLNNPLILQELDINHSHFTEQFY